MVENISFKKDKILIPSNIKGVWDLVQYLHDTNKICFIKILRTIDKPYFVYQRDDDLNYTNSRYSNLSSLCEDIHNIVYNLFDNPNNKSELYSFDWKGKCNLRDRDNFIDELKKEIRLKTLRVNDVRSDADYDSLIFKDVDDNKLYFNLFQSSHWLKNKPELSGEYPVIKKILLNICGLSLLDKDELGIYDWIFNWLAIAIQKPTLRVSNGVISCGYPGSGKGEFTDILKEIFGKTLSVVDPERFKSKYNKFLEGKFFIIGNEIAYSNSQERYFVANKLKPLITDKYIQVEDKFEPIRDSKNFARVIIFSNDRSPIALEKGDRRYIVTRQKTTLLPSIDLCTKGIFSVDFYNNWKKTKRAEELNNFIFALHNYPIDVGLIYKPPMITNGKAQIQALSMTDFEDVVYKIIHRRLDLILVNTNGEKGILYNTIYLDFLAEFENKQNHKYNNMSRRKFTAYLSNHCDMETKRTSMDNELGSKTYILLKQTHLETVSNDMWGD